MPRHLEDRERNPDDRIERGAERKRPSLVVQGTIREALPHAMYAIELDNGQRVLGHISASLRTRYVRVLPGDRVALELSAYDLSRGRITEQLKK